MVNEVSCKPRRTSLGRTGFETNKAGTQQTIWLPPYCLFKTEENTVPPLIRRHKKNVNPNKPWFLRVCSTSLLKTLWEKEKLLITSNLSFSHHVF